MVLKEGAWEVEVGNFNCLQSHLHNYLHGANSKLSLEMFLSSSRVLPTFQSKPFRGDAELILNEMTAIRGEKKTQIQIVNGFHSLTRDCKWCVCTNQPSLDLNSLHSYPSLAIYFWNFPGLWFATQYFHSAVVQIQKLRLRIIIADSVRNGYYVHNINL